MGQAQCGETDPRHLQHGEILVYGKNHQTKRSARYQKAFENQTTVFLEEKDPKQEHAAAPEQFQALTQSLPTLSEVTPIKTKRAPVPPLNEALYTAILTPAPVSAAKAPRQSASTECALGDVPDGKDAAIIPVDKPNVDVALKAKEILAFFEPLQNAIVIALASGATVAGESFAHMKQSSTEALEHMKRSSKETLDGLPSALEGMRKSSARGLDDIREASRRAHALLYGAVENGNAQKSMRGSQDALPDGSYSQGTQNSVADLARRALQSADLLMREYRVLDAEKVLAEALWQLEAVGSPELLENFTKHPVFHLVLARVACYDAVGPALEEIRNWRPDRGSEFQLVAETEDYRLWLDAPPNESWFQTWFAMNLDAPLTHCIVATKEFDLQPEWQDLLVDTPECLGSRRCLHQVIRALQSVTLMRVELITESLLMPNFEYGAVVESIRSEFPSEGLEIPERSWFAKRIDVDVTNTWIPKGGGSRGTVLVQRACFQTGMPVPENILSYITESAAPKICSGFKKSTSLLNQPGDNPWARRLRDDQYGTYALVKKVEQVAATRGKIDAYNLPGKEIINRQFFGSLRRAARTDYRKLSGDAAFRKALEVEFGDETGEIVLL